MSRAAKISLLLLVLGVAFGAFYLRGLHKRVLELARPEPSEEQARREITRPLPPPATEKKEKTVIYWAAPGGSGAVEPVEVELALPPDPAQRARQVLLVLVASPPKIELRTLPADTVLLEFYLLGDGTAVADFSDTLARATPSGILSEQMAVESILRTLEANVPQIRRVKILINGQEVDTLAGHADLSEFFELRPAAEKPALTQSAPPGKLEH